MTLWKGSFCTRSFTFYTGAYMAASAFGVSLLLNYNTTLYTIQENYTSDCFKVAQVRTWCCAVLLFISENPVSLFLRYHGFIVLCCLVVYTRKQAGLFLLNVVFMVQPAFFEQSIHSLCPTQHPAWTLITTFIMKSTNATHGIFLCFQITSIQWG